MGKRGAKSKYETCVLPYLDTIQKKVREGVIEAEIARSLGISVASLNNYRNQHSELKRALSKDKGKDELEALVNAGIEAAKGCYKTNKQTVYTVDDEGNPVIEKIIENEVWQPPNASLNKFYVQNFGKEQEYSTDPLQYQLKKQKQELEEKIEKLKNWHLKL